MPDTIKIRLDLSKNRLTNETIKSVPVEFKTAGGLSENTDLSKNLNLYQLYNEERDACRAYRLLFTMNPICSNVLFNRMTEIVVNEGGDDELTVYSDFSGEKLTFDNNTPVINNSELTKNLLLDDTELTLEDIYSQLTRNNKKVNSVKYHCGLDMLNNHLLRSTSFDQVNLIENRSAEFNTINDYVRNNKGASVTEILTETAGDNGKAKEVKRHLYGVDTFYTFNESFKYNCIELDGWFGFKNTSNLHIVNGCKATTSNNVVLNRVMNNYKPCSFVDMYPDRSLFSFNPKYNKIKNRPEYNWKYVVTYPYLSDYDKANELNHNTSNAIECVEVKLLHTNSGAEMVQMLSKFRHAIKNGEYVRLYYIRKSDFIEGDVELTRHYVKSQVFSIGDENNADRNRFFTLLMKNLEDTMYYSEENGLILNGDEDLPGNSLLFFYRKEVRGVECKYYFRKFKEILSADGERLKYSSNKLSYGENIYGDRVAQVIFTDDILTDGLVDNMGNEVSEVYLAILKNNDDEEYSKCWGKVTSGLDLPLVKDINHEVIDDCKDYNVRCLHNVARKESVLSNDKTFDIYNCIYKHEIGNDYVLPSVLEDDIHLEDEEMTFYGDVVEFDCANYKENVIEQVYHRVNTKQREDTSGDYRHFIINEIIYDDYDSGVIDGCTGFTVQSKDISDLGGNNFYQANVCPEGYMYYPFHRVQLMEFDDNVQTGRPTVINFVPSNDQVMAGNNGTSKTYSFIAPIDLGFDFNDNIILYFTEEKEYVWGYIENVSKRSDNTIILKVRYTSNKTVDVDTTRILYPKQNIPTYAIYEGSTNSIYWREHKVLSEVANDSKLIDTPFSNGRLYFEENVNFFMRRQDPFSESNLCKPLPISNYSDKLRDYTIEGDTKTDFSGILYVDNNIISTCE